MNRFPGTRSVVEVLDIPTDIPASWRARQRGVTRRQIESCTACGLVCGMPHHPVPFSGPSDPLCLAIGEGPGSDEARQLQPFVGRSGRLLRAMLNHAGLPPEDILFGNVVSCWPKVGEGKGVKTRVPNYNEMAACRPNLLSQLALTSNPYVLLVGGTALSAVRNDLKVSKIHGRLFLWTIGIPVDGYTLTPVSFWVMAILHPATILRQQIFKATTQVELSLWREVITGETDPWDIVPTSCVVCDKSYQYLDPDGIGYCEQHWARYGDNWRLARRHWEKEAEGEKPTQQSLI